MLKYQNYTPSHSTQPLNHEGTDKNFIELIIYEVFWGINNSRSLAVPASKPLAGGRQIKSISLWYSALPHYYGCRNHVTRDRSARMRDRRGMLGGCGLLAGRGRDIPKAPLFVYRICTRWLMHSLLPIKRSNRVWLQTVGGIAVCTNHTPCGWGSRYIELWELSLIRN